MRYGSVCSGIEAATAAWHHMAWEPAFFSEIEAFPCAVLSHHYPEVPLHGDFTTIEKNQYGKIDLLVGGTPCQSFSVAGLRGGLDDQRGNLALEFCRLAQREQPRWIVWENVPGVLSSSGGRDFGSILGALEDLGYGLAYRVLDAQYFGVAQRRRRVFVVGYLGDWRRAAAVLFERHSLSGHLAPRREARKDAARAIASGAEERGGCGGDGSSVDWPADVACTLDTDFASKWGQNNQHVNAGCPLFVPSVANAITASLANAATGRNKDENVIAFDAYNQTETDEVSKTVAARNDQDTASCVAYAIMPMNSGKDYKARETEVAQPIMAAGPVGGNQGGDFIVTPFDTTQISSPHNYSNPQAGDPCHPLAAGAHAPTIAFSFKDSGNDASNNISPTLRSLGAYDANGGSQVAVVAFSSNMSTPDCQTDGTTPTLKLGGHGNNPPAIAYAIQAGALRTNPASGPDGVGVQVDHAYTLEARSEVQAVAFGLATPVTPKWWEELSPTLTQPSPTGGGQPTAVAITSAVRRLTPVECERLQGFPDNYTAIPWRKKGAEDCPDGPRYKALGNSMAVPVMRWIGERIQVVDDLISVL